MKMDIQIRHNGGELTQRNDMSNALNFNEGDWDKISFAVAPNERFIIYRDGTWEHRTPASLRSLFRGT